MKICVNNLVFHIGIPFSQVQKDESFQKNTNIGEENNFKS